jgi:hypothetical protein
MAVFLLNDGDEFWRGKLLVAAILGRKIDAGGDGFCHARRVVHGDGAGGFCGAGVYALAVDALILALRHA